MLAVMVALLSVSAEYMADVLLQVTSPYTGLFSAFPIADMITYAGFFIAVLAPFVLAFRFGPRLGGKFISLFSKNAK